MRSLTASLLNDIINFNFMKNCK